MLQITVPDKMFFDDDRQEFITYKGAVLQMEHSLVSVSKWEAKWHKPFLSKKPKTPEEARDYYRCMTLTQHVNPEVYLCIDDRIAAKIEDYINDPMTATTFSDDDKSVNNTIITSEVIYYWLTAYNIPFECQKWHLNRLLTLIHVCGKKSNPKKMSNAEHLKRNAAINARNRKRFGSRG